MESKGTREAKKKGKGTQIHYRREGFNRDTKGLGPKGRAEKGRSLIPLRETTQLWG